MNGPTHQLRQQVIRDLEQVRLVRKIVHTTLISVGKAAMQRSIKPPVKPKHVGTVTSQGDVDALAVPTVRVVRQGHKYHRDGMVQFFQWLASITEVGAPVVFVSYFQFNALYEHAARQGGVQYCKRMTMAQTVIMQSATQFR